MIGVYDYSVVLTYLSLMSGALGVIVCLHGVGHPFIGIFFLMFSGLCDTFDGKVARMKKNRTEDEKAFGVQIDSLADLIAFGVLPACIGIAVLRVSTRFTDVPILRVSEQADKVILYPILMTLIAVLYILAAMIRLAYFNVQEAKRQQEETGARKYYTGMPVTMAALIFPTILLIQFLSQRDLTLVYFGAMLVTAFLFLSKLKVRKPQMTGIMILIAIGVVEFILLLVVRFALKFPWKGV